MSYVNSLSQTLFLQNQIKTQQNQLTVLQQIVANGGRTSDNFAGFTADVGRLGIRLRSQIARNDAYNTTISSLALRTQNIETALTAADSSINYLSNTIVTLNNQDQTGRAVRQTAQSTLAQIVSNFNVTADGVSLFAGIATNTTSTPYFPITSDSSLTTNLRASLGASPGYTSVAAAQTAVTTYFSTTSNWFVPGAAGVPAAPAQIADDRTIQASISANPSTPTNNAFGIAVRDALSTTASIATIQPSDFADYNATTGTSQLYQNFLVSQTAQFNNASKELNQGVAINGIVRHQLGDQQTITKTTNNLLQQGLDNAEVQDTATSITNLNNLQTQLQATYQVTAQLKSLSLANFLPV